MKTMLLGFAALMTLTATAAAESYDATQPTPPNNTYVIAGASAGWQRDFRAGLQLEGGSSIDGSRLFVRGQLTTGKNTDNGDYQQARVGIEGRGCVVREFFCAFTGVDGGYQHDLVDMTPWTWGLGDGPADPVFIDAHDLIVVPRAGVEMGKDIKTRLAVELPFHRRLDSKMDSDTSGGGMGFALSLGFGYAF